MKKKNRTSARAHEPVDCLASIFTARRDLLEPIREGVMRNVALTVDEGDTLTQLYGCRELGWHEMEVEPGGFVRVAELRRHLVHDAGKFSRRIKDMRGKGLIEVEESSRGGSSKRGYVQKVRISDKGIKWAKPLWDRYRVLASRLLKGLPESDLEAHCRVNQKISDSIAKLREGIWAALVE